MIEAHECRGLTLLLFIGGTCRNASRIRLTFDLPLYWTIIINIAWQFTPTTSCRIVPVVSSTYNNYFLQLSDVSTRSTIFFLTHIFRLTRATFQPEVLLRFDWPPRYYFRIVRRSWIYVSIDLPQIRRTISEYRFILNLRRHLGPWTIVPQIFRHEIGTRSGGNIVANGVAL